MKNVIEKYRTEINFFIEVLKKDSSICLDNFYKNLKTLKIYEQNTINIGDADGSYDYEKNEIVLTPKSFESRCFYHELFHMASTAKDDIAFYNGFLAVKISDEAEYGLGLNEGYTELLCERYFGTATVQYYIERIFAKQIEKILGEDFLKEHYFSPRYNSVFKELEKYTSSEKTHNFFVNFDNYTKYTTYVKDNNKITETDLQEFVDNCVLFLFECYINKSLQEHGHIDEDKLNEYINDFTLTEVEIVPLGTVKIMKSLIDKGFFAIEEPKNNVK